MKGRINANMAGKEALTKDLLEAAKILVSHLNPSGKCTFCNQEEHIDAPYCPVFGLEKVIQKIMEG